MKPLMFQSGIDQALFVAAVILFAVQQVLALWSTLRLTHGGGSSTRDRGSYMAVQVTVLAGVILGYEAAIHLAGATITWHPRSSTSVGSDLSCWGVGPAGSTSGS